MTPQEIQPSIRNSPDPFKGKDPTRISRGLAIAMVFSVVFLIIAVGVIVWLFMTPRNPVATQANKSTDDLRDVKSVSLVPPAALPDEYVKNDQSGEGYTQVYYYDDASNCGFTVGIDKIEEGKSVKDVVVGAITTAQAQGVTTSGRSDGDLYELKDADDADKTYKFESINLEQDVKVDGLSFTKQSNAILYKQFGQQIASLSYACKAETWTDKKAELATLVSNFTVKTER